MWSKCLTDTLQKRMRSYVCMACVDAPRLSCGFCILSHPCWRFHTPWQNSCLLITNSHADLPPGFYGSDCFMCAFLYSVNLGLSHLTCFVSMIWSIFTYHLFSARPFLACCLSIILSFLSEWLLHCQVSSYWQSCHYSRTVKKLQACTHLTFTHVKAKDRDKKLLQLCSVLFGGFFLFVFFKICQRAPYTFVFNFPLWSFLSEKLRKTGLVVSICSLTSYASIS